MPSKKKSHWTHRFMLGEYPCKAVIRGKIIYINCADISSIIAGRHYNEDNDSIFNGYNIELKIANANVISHKDALEIYEKIKHKSCPLDVVLERRYSRKTKKSVTIDEFRSLLFSMPEARLDNIRTMAPKSIIEQSNKRTIETRTSSVNIIEKRQKVDNKPTNIPIVIPDDTEIQPSKEILDLTKFSSEKLKKLVSIIEDPQEIERINVIIQQKEDKEWEEEYKKYNFCSYCGKEVKTEDSCCQKCGKPYP
jgi:hypothetical protein